MCLPKLKKQTKFTLLWIFNKILREGKNKKNIISDFASLWPNAFLGVEI